ncbi:SprT family zinc-dependent metalloprotease [Shewanella sp. WXL01]|uniref:Protein SprT n=1 Tax=Shewanella maritima TaxID=2520507 RepID=A0A411PG60_9GAMM|nr:MULTISPECIES: SprT family zinc-dependent metalloprotease [Shewanella]NKF49283.1 SprT family zinc-dependent metalloprotease [Shewanella sp. WXL01]QBF82586.1 SprT family zinc-dependent metalloprotease [Shewanella maritima]
MPTHLTAQQIQQVHSKLEADYQKADAYFNQQFPRPELALTLRGKSAGTAHLQLNKIRLNPVLLKENFDAFIEHVIPHEVSHLLAYQLYGKVRPHGREWQSIMLKVFGQQPSTTHQLDIRSVQGKMFNYQCGCGVVPLTIRRHNKVVRGETKYRCRRCSETLAISDN